MSLWLLIKTRNLRTIYYLMRSFRRGILGPIFDIQNFGVVRAAVNQKSTSQSVFPQIYFQAGNFRWSTLHLPCIKSGSEVWKTMNNPESYFVKKSQHINLHGLNKQLFFVTTYHSVSILWKITNFRYSIVSLHWKPSHTSLCFVA